MKTQTVVTITRISDDEADTDEVWIDALSTDDEADVYAADVVEVLGTIECGKIKLIDQTR